MAQSKFLSLSMLLLSTTMLCYQANGQSPLPSTMVLYLQDVAKGPNSTVSPVIGLTGKDWTYDQFGTIFALDDPVMSGPSPLSDAVGRAQGMMVVSSHDATNVNAVFSIVFTNLQYSGSTLEIQGISRQRENYKELSVVSGTGKFRFARGYVALETAFYDPETAHSVVRMTVTLKQS